MEIAESMAWVIVDEIPEEGVVVQWGAGHLALFLLENTPVLELYLIDTDHETHIENWKSVLEEDRPRTAFSFCPVDDRESAEDYTFGALSPVDRADSIVIGGWEPRLCACVAAMVAKPGAFLYLLDSQEEESQWIYKMLEGHPDWAVVQTFRSLPEDRLQDKAMGMWKRLGN